MNGNDHIRLLLTAGDGPAECRQAVAGILNRMEAEADLYGVTLSVHSNGAKHGPRSAVVLVHGPARRAFADSWRGTIQWTMQSQLRRTHKRRNWFIGVFTLEDAQADAVKIRAADVTFSTLRAGGPGGQHQNTTDSAVRATHTDTGLTVVAREARSQHRNKALALDRLQNLANAHAAATAQDRKARQNQLHRTLERGNPVRRFKGARFREVSH
ncbi:MAG: peptide chain release factor H [Pikeienuella sp.]